MLDRPQRRPRAPPKEGRAAGLQRARARRYRARTKVGELVVAVKIDLWVVDWLIQSGFLPTGATATGARSRRRYRLR
jgi:hypothetical protein